MNPALVVDHVGLTGEGLEATLLAAFVGALAAVTAAVAGQRGMLETC